MKVFKYYFVFIQNLCKLFGKKFSQNDLLSKMFALLKMCFKNEFKMLFYKAYSLISNRIVLKTLFLFLHYASKAPFAKFIKFY
jgi:hypothetical protein